MLIHRIILLLLSWQCARAIEDEKPPPDDVTDQMAIQSENQPVSLKDEKVFIASSTTPSPLKATMIHYENSNGFVPMNSIDETIDKSSYNTEMKKISVDNNENGKLKPINSRSEKFEMIEDDPAYSTEARMFLNLAGPNADRRSYDTNEGERSEFEILKINDETPAIANYQDFYENVRNNLNRDRAQLRYEESRDEGRTNIHNKRTKDRIKQIEKYLAEFNGNEKQRTADSQDQYYNGYENRNAASANRQKEIFESGKSQTYNEKSIGSKYDVYDETPTRHKISSVFPSSQNDEVTKSRSRYYQVSPKTHHGNPVVIVEPTDYKINMNYGSQQVTGKVSNIEQHKSQKQHRKEIQQGDLINQYDDGSRSNGEDRYGTSYERNDEPVDYSEEEEYHEVTEKPRRIPKIRRRPYGAENARRLPKEHRERDNLESDDSRRNNSPSRSKLHRSKAKPSHWLEDERVSNSEEISEEQSGPIVVTSKPSSKKSKPRTKSRIVTSWSQIAPNIEVSHSNGFEIDENDKPKLLVPVNLNLLPLTNFDHSSALSNSQGFDLSNVPNFVTATPIAHGQSTINPISQSVVNSGTVNPSNQQKNIRNSLNNNYGLSTPVPDIIVGQNTYQNPVQAVLLSQMNVHDKIPSNLRSHYSPSTVAPIFTVTSLEPNLQNIVPTMTSVSLQNYQNTQSPSTINQIDQNYHHINAHPSASPTAPQLLMPQPTFQTFPVLTSPYNGYSNYNILVNPNGLHGQNVVQNGNQNGQSGTGLNSPSSTVTPQTFSNNNFNLSEMQIKKNIGSNNHGQFVTTASFSVGNEQQHGQSNMDNKYYLSTINQLPVNNNYNNNDNNNINNNNLYGNPNNQHQARPQQQENLYHTYRDDQNSNGKIETYSQTAQVVPAIIHHTNAIPINFNNQKHQSVRGQLQEQQSIMKPSIVAHRPRHQSQHILNAANDIFENTWKQLQQLRSNEEAGSKTPYQNVYGINDNLGSTSNSNSNTINSFPGVNAVQAQLPILPTQNVEIANPNIKPSPVDVTLGNSYESLHHYPAAILTTPIPIFGTTANFLLPRPVMINTTPNSSNLQNYLEQLKQIGGQQNNQANKMESQPNVNDHQDHQRQIFNPINFVPNLDLMKSQSMLNSKTIESLPNKLNLVPLMPGGNFFKNSPGAQTELVQKPRLSSDLEKYAEEMFKESLKTIYSSHKWNNDRRLRGNYSTSAMNELAKLKSDLQRFKASLPDPSYNGKDILEAHHSENNVRTAESSGRPSKKPELSLADIEQIFKSDFKLNSSPVSSESLHHGSHHKNRPGSSRPAATSDHSSDFKNMKQLSNYLTPPKIHSFLSKSPFLDSPKSGKKRPGSTSSRYNSGSSRPVPRPTALISRPTSNPEASASNHVESGIKSDTRHRYEKYRSYPTFTSTSSSSSDNDVFKTSSSEQTFNTDYYDINHPRMHNLLGLLMKSKQLPRGASQSYFRDDDDLRYFYENDKRRIHSQFPKENNGVTFQKRSNVPINMGPPVAPNLTNNNRPARGGT